MKHGNRYIKNLVLSAMFLALGIVLPFVTGQVPQVGSMLLPILIAIIPVTVLVMVTAGRTTQALAGRRKEADDHAAAE